MVYNYTLAISSIIFSLFFLIYAFQLPEASGSSHSLGPSHWPIAVLIIMMAMGVTLLKNTVKNRNKNDKEINKEDSNKIKQAKQENLITKYKQWIVLIIIILYSSSMAYIGFLLSTIIFLFIATLIMGLQSKRKSILIAAIGASVLVLLFGNLLNIPLPRGVDIFRDLSYMIY